MITRMAKVEVTGPKKLLLPTVDALHRFGKLHIASTRFTDLPEFASVEDPKLDDEQTAYLGKLKEMLKKSREIRQLLSEIGDQRLGFDKGLLETAGAIELDHETVAKKLDDHGQQYQKIRALMKRKQELQEELATVSRYDRIISAFGPLLEALPDSANREIIGFAVRKTKVAVLDILREEVRQMTNGRFDLFTRDFDDNTVAGVVAVSRQHSREVRRLFVTENVSEMRLPERYEGKSPMDVIATLKQRGSQIPDEIEAVSREIETLKRESPRGEDSQGEFGRLESSLEDRISELNAVGSTSRGMLTFFFTGWLPERNFEEFLAFAREHLDPSVVINRIPVGRLDLESQRIPVILENPPLIRPFELCLKLFPRPSYDTIDPTPFVAIFFPTIFGLILGDVAYGLVLLAASVFVHYRYRKYVLGNSVSIILFACSLSSIIFGVLYGEFLGDLGQRWGVMRPLLVNRETALIPTLMLAVGMGAAHIALGIIIKAYTSIKWKQYGHAVEAVSTLLILVALGLLIASLTGLLPPGFRQAGTYAIVILIPVLIASGGIVALLEIFGIIGNILSYARIMAIGLASVILAVVANRMAGKFGNIVVGTMIAVLLHVINLILGVFGPTIHGMRLHYVEFFSKFYHTGSAEYQPLIKKSPPPATEPKQATLSHG